jgi:hypothetical protein
MKANSTSIFTEPLTVSREIRSYTELQEQVHDALRIQHPEWIETNGDCPTCDSYESRLAELLGLQPTSTERNTNDGNKYEADYRDN